MRRKIALLILLIVGMEGIAGCQYTEKEINDVNRNIEKEESKTNKEEVRKESETSTKQAEKESEIDTTRTEKENETSTEQEIQSETTMFQQDSHEETTKRIYDKEYYGSVEEVEREFFDEETGDMAYYYKMERFFVNDSFVHASAINNTLKQIYDEYESGYFQDSKLHTSLDSIAMPYSFWHILRVTYAGEDYISILYNDVYHMGGAHPYSRFNGITIDCATGEEVSASYFLQKSEEEILLEVSHKMGFSSVVSWDDIDFYIENASIVFFYRMPGFREEVALSREK